MVSNEDIDHICEYFLLRNIKWRINGELCVPSRDQIVQLIEECIQMVRAETDSISIEIGHLLVKRTDNKIDVYVHAGDLDYA